MQGSPRVIEILNEALTAELTAVNQYFIASKMAADWGYAKLAKEYYDESIGEMKHAETLIERILFLEGHPNLQRLFTVGVGESVVEQFRLNYEMEKAAVERYRRGISVCNEEGDPGSRAFLEEFLAEEEHHVDEAETQLANLEQLGEQLWLAKWV
ncbi:MAG TPA: bacterioferritin [Egibacteraceae bacterium]|nr:bacterioferritin [Egibacteraceae bacterium]